MVLLKPSCSEGPGCTSCGGNGEKKVAERLRRRWCRSPTAREMPLLPCLCTNILLNSPLWWSLGQMQIPPHMSIHCEGCYCEFFQSCIVVLYYIKFRNLCKEVICMLNTWITTVVLLSGLYCEYEFFSSSAQGKMQPRVIIASLSLVQILLLPSYSTPRLSNSVKRRG